MENILDFIPTGEENAISSENLMNLGGYKSIQDLQKHIELLRNQGHIICSATQPPGGYFIHQNRQELAAFVRTLENRAGNTLRSLESARKALSEMESSEQAIGQDGLLT